MIYILYFFFKSYTRIVLNLRGQLQSKNLRYSVTAIDINEDKST